MTRRTNPTESTPVGIEEISGTQVSTLAGAIDGAHVQVVGLAGHQITGQAVLGRWVIGIAQIHGAGLRVETAAVGQGSAGGRIGEVTRATGDEVVAHVAVGARDIEEDLGAAREVGLAHHEGIGDRCLVGAAQQCTRGGQPWSIEIGPLDAAAAGRGAGRDRVGGTGGIGRGDAGGDGDRTRVGRTVGQPADDDGTAAAGVALPAARGGVVGQGARAE